MYAVHLHLQKIRSNKPEAEEASFIQESPMPIVTCLVHRLTLPFSQSTGVNTKSQFRLDINQRSTTIIAEVEVEEEIMLTTDMATFEVAMAGAGWRKQ